MRKYNCVFIYLHIDNTVAHMGEITNPHKFWSEELHGRDALGRSRRRWWDVIRMDIREMEWEGVDWIHLAQNRKTSIWLLRPR